VLLSDFISWTGRSTCCRYQRSVQFEWASLQQMNFEQVDGTSKKCKEFKRPKNDPEDSSSRRVPMN
jgi:hypothetical protein